MRRESRLSTIGLVLASLLWTVFVVGVGFLSGFRSINTSTMADLIEFKDIPILEFFDEHYVLLGWVTGVVGVLCVALAGWWYSRRRDRDSLWLAIGVTVGALSAGIACRAPDLSPSFFDWLHALAVVVATVFFMLSVSGFAQDELETPTPAKPAGTALHVLSALYLLSVVSVVLFAAFEHLRMWSPDSNGGFNYSQFFRGDGEIESANLVLFSTSALFATLAGLFACVWGWLLKLTTRTAGRGVYGELIPQAGLCALTLALICSVPWIVRGLGIELKGDENYFFPVGVIVAEFAALAPMLFVSLVLIVRDFAPRNEEEQFELDRAERTFLGVSLFLIYPLIRPLRRYLSPRGWYVALLVTGLLMLGGTTYLAHKADSLWEFEDWRGMFKSAQFPVFRVFLSLGAAAGLMLVGQRGLRRLRAKTGADTEGARAPLWLGARWAINIAAVSCLCFATFPLWGWDDVSHNVHARVCEYNGRHKFERNFLQWLLDFDGDGYSSFLGGGDPDDFDFTAQTGGIAPLAPAPVPIDEYEIVDAKKAAAFPNVVLLTWEGVTPTSISAYGRRSVISTPTIDAIAREGTRFERVYCAYPSTWDGWFMTISARQVCIEEFTSNLPFGDRYTRYNNLLKVLKTVGIERYCFADATPYARLFVPEEDRAKDWEQPDFTVDRTDEEKEQNVTEGDKRIDRVVRFIESLEEGERFYATEHLSDTHFPWRFVEQEEAERLGYPLGFEFTEADSTRGGVELEKLRGYHHQITRMDTQVQRIVDALKAKGVYDNTMIVMISDHGCQFFEHEHMYYVSHLYEQSLRVPLIIRYPGGTKGLVRSQPGSQMDIVPTIMELAGVRQVQRDQPFPGRSLAPLLSAAPLPDGYEDDLRERDILLKTHYDTVGLLSNFRYKLIFDRPTNTYLLFDLETDPAEMINLADSRPELLSDMLERLRVAAAKYPAFLGGIERSSVPDDD